MSTVTHPRNTADHDCKTPSQMVLEAWAVAKANLSKRDRADFVVGFLDSVMSSLWRDSQQLLRAHRTLATEHNELIDRCDAHEPTFWCDDEEAALFFRRDLGDLPVPVDELVSEQLNERL